MGGIAFVRLILGYLFILLFAAAPGRPVQLLRFITYGTNTVPTVGSAILDSIAQKHRNQRYSQPVHIQIDGDLLRKEPPTLNQLLTDQPTAVGNPFRYAIEQAFLYNLPPFIATQKYR
ncbi:hypothetical protein LX87_02316 [Larkinella arboricola]|uniref:Uncharacterized protein n=1 Tax=Larkinella arboricola TaxID=643671 RepID=A0A327WX97_LARAB|nr:hypothetical protein [Larkinella arboricola]RAJ97416.1 hypothetical protein LX87_02316 [Larkinella arboricola]